MGGRGGASHRQTAGSLVNGQLGRDPRLAGFRVFSDPNDAYNWHTLNNFDWDRWNQMLSHAERLGIQMYTGSYYGVINTALRENQAPDASTRDIINNLKAGLDRWESTEEFITFRGANRYWTANLLGGTEAQLSNANFLRSRIGKQVTDKGFMSSAVTESDAWFGVKYKIYVPKGVSGMYVDPISRNRGEREFLFNAGTRFIVHEIKTDSSGRIESMTLEALPTKKRRR